MKTKILGLIAVSAVCLGLVSVSHAQITNALVVHLAFDGTDASGNYTNTIANGIVGMPSGSPVTAPGKLGSAVSLTVDPPNLINNYVSLGYPPELQFGAVSDNTDVDFSIAFWCNYTNQSSDPCFIASQDWDSSSNPGWGIYMQGNGNVRIVTATARSQMSSPAGGVLRDGTWHHVVVTWARRGNLSFYKDGAFVASTSLAATTGLIDTVGLGLNVNIGQDGTGNYPAPMADMRMDDLGIWRRVLSAGEITAIYTAGLGGTNLSKVPAIVNPFVKSTTPAHQATGVRPDSVIAAVLTDGLNQVTNPVLLKVNGATVAASVTKVGQDTTVQAVIPPGTLLPAGANTATVIFGNNAVPQKLFTNTWTFAVASYVTLTPDLKVTADTSKRGFKWNIFANQANVLNDNARTEAALAGLLTDATGAPLPNLADPTVQGVALAAASAPSPANAPIKFEIAGVLNLDRGAGNFGNFQPDGQMPGLPAIDASTDGAAAEAITYLSLPAGLITMGVNSDDGFRTTAGVVPQDAFSGLTAGEYNGGRGAADTIFYVAVQEAGVYGFRTTWENGGSDADIEWFTVNNLTNKVLVNDTANGGVTAYRAVTTPIPPYIKYVEPAPVQRQVNQTSSSLVIILSDGTTALDDSPGSIVLKLDGSVIAPVKSRSGSVVTLTYTPTTLQFPGDMHVAELTFKNVGGTYTRTQEWRFYNLKNIVLPAPALAENFDSYAEGSVPTGWTAWNFTDCSGSFCATPGLDLDDLNSDSYKGWIVVSRARLEGLKTQGTTSRIFRVAPNQTSNGVPVTVDMLSQGNLLYAETDVRDDNQVQFITTKPFNLSSVNNAALAFSSLYEQNQDNVDAVEYSVDGGGTWLPVVYFVDFLDGGGDIRLNADGTVDALRTFNDANADTAVWTDGGVVKGGKYGDGIAAPITQALGRFVAPRANDDSTIDKRIEIFRLPMASKKSDVRLRFAQLGTASWYFGVDNLAFYDVAAPVVPRLSISSASGNTLTVSWMGTGTLLEASALTGTWTVSASQGNPQTVSVTGAAKFYKIGPP